MGEAVRWVSPGPKMTREQLVQAANSRGIDVPEPMLWLLSEVVNGGAPEGVLEFRIPGGAEGEEAALDGLYGLNHPDQNYDLVDLMQSELATYFPGDAFPLGFDEGSGQLFIMTGTGEGEIRHAILDELFNPEGLEPDLRFVASNLYLFAKELNLAPWVPGYGG